MELARAAGSEWVSIDIAAIVRAQHATGLGWHGSCNGSAGMTASIDSTQRSSSAGFADIAGGIAGALGIMFDLLTPFLRPVRSHWGLTAAEAARRFVGDEYVPEPAWGWTHAIEIDAPAEKVWPWVAQLGQDKAGFYSYQGLENLAGCNIRNADAIHPEWTQLRAGSRFSLHPKAPPLRIAHVEPGRCFVVSDLFDPSTGRAPEPERRDRWVHVSWLFLIETIGYGRSRLISRYRVAYGRSWLMRLFYGAWTIESIGFVMDRRMLLGVKQRVERSCESSRA